MYITAQNDFFDFMRTSASGNAESAPVSGDADWVFVNTGEQCYIFVDNDVSVSGTVDLDFYVKMRTKLEDDIVVYKVIKFGSAAALGIRNIAIVSFGGTLRGGRFWLKPVITSSTEEKPFDIYYMVV